MNWEREFRPSRISLGHGRSLYYICSRSNNSISITINFKWRASSPIASKIFICRVDHLIIMPEEFSFKIKINLEHSIISSIELVNSKPFFIIARYFSYIDIIFGIILMTNNSRTPIIYFKSSRRPSVSDSNIPRLVRRVHKEPIFLPFFVPNFENFSSPLRYNVNFQIFIFHKNSFYFCWFSFASPNILW
jgi:hypothetical protein